MILILMFWIEESDQDYYLDNYLSQSSPIFGIVKPYYACLDQKNEIKKTQPIMNFYQCELNSLIHWLSHHYFSVIKSWNWEIWNVGFVFRQGDGICPNFDWVASTRKHVYVSGLQNLQIQRQDGLVSGNKLETRQGPVSNFPQSPQSSRFLEWWLTLIP